MTLRQAAPPDLTRDDLRLVVDQFYGRIQNDPMLGPVFGAHVEDWPAHLEKMTNFWCSVMLGHHEYQGNPRIVHAGIPELRLEMFGRWLELFAEVANQTLPDAKADAIITRSQIMGRSMSRALRLTP